MYCTIWKENFKYSAQSFKTVLLKVLCLNQFVLELLEVFSLPFVMFATLNFVLLNIIKFTPVVCYKVSHVFLSIK